MNILVTGGAGFIGSNFIRYSLANQSASQLVNLDCLTYAGNVSNLADISDRYTFVEGDICDEALVTDILYEYRIDLLVHFAAETHVDKSNRYPELFHKTNFTGTLTLLEAFRKYSLTLDKADLARLHFHHISTDEVFGSLAPEDAPFSESSPFRPNSIYAATKAASDVLARSYYHAFDLPVTITNCSNNYGPYQYPEKLLPLLIINAQAGKLLPVYGDGLQIRDWIYVTDHCRAIWKVIQFGAAGEVFLVGGNNQFTNLEIVNNLCGLMDKKLSGSSDSPYRNLVHHIGDRPGHDRRYAVSTAKILKELGWEPDITLGEGLELTLNWYLEHPEWLDQVIKQPGYQQWIKEHYSQNDNYQA